VHVQIALRRELVGCALCGRVATSARDLASRTCEPVLLVRENGAWNRRHIRLQAFLGALTEAQRAGELPACYAAIC
jgi:hypothetical protein